MRTSTINWLRNHPNSCPACLTHCMDDVPAEYHEDIDMFLCDNHADEERKKLEDKEDE